MRLRLGRGLHRHNLQAVLDFEDFIWNRTDGSPAHVFKKLADAAYEYVTTPNCDAERISNLTYKLPADDVETIHGLDLSKIKTLCTPSVYSKTKRFETKHSEIYSTQTSKVRRCIVGQYRAAKIYDQSVTWGCDESDTENPNAFNLSTILVYCTCKYFKKATCVNGLCCSHVIGQLRRTIYLTSENWLKNHLHGDYNLQCILSINTIFLFYIFNFKKSAVLIPIRFRWNIDILISLATNCYV